jgi:hypothetical protein
MARDRSVTDVLRLGNARAYPAGTPNSTLYFGPVVGKTDSRLVISLG